MSYDTDSEAVDSVTEEYPAEQEYPDIQIDWNSFIQSRPGPELIEK